MPDCIFCKIIAGQLPAKKVYEDELVIAFRDIHPVAPTHVLLVPRKHVASVNDLEVEDEQLAGHLFTIVRLVASQEGIASSGYRLIVNSGRDGGQIVYHLHMHLIGGQRMRHPIG